MEKINTEANVVKSEIYNTEVLATIAEAYGLASLQFIGSPASGLITENALLQDLGGCKYFAKLYNFDDIDKLASVYRACELAAQNPLTPVVLPLLPTDGSYTVPIQGTSFALFPYIEHEENMPEDLAGMNILLFNTAEALGRIHATSIPENEPRLQPIQR